MTFIPARSSLDLMRSPYFHWLAMLTLCLGAAGVHASDATPQSQAQAWEGLKARLAIGTAAPARSDPSVGDAEPHKINTLSLMGDYYLSRPWLGKTGGWRATSGVLLGARSSVWSSPSLLDRRIAGDGNDAGTQPYLGLGYTGWSSKGGWGLSADVGLMGLSRSTPRFGKSGPSSSLDDTVRDLRFAPLLQLGVSYSF